MSSGFSDIVMDHFRRPRNAGRLDPCDVQGVAGTPGQGPFMLLTVRLDGDCICEVQFQTFGCGPAIAAGSLLTELVCGRRLADAADMDRETLVEALGGLPHAKLYCADLAVDAWRDVLEMAPNGDGC